MNDHLVSGLKNLPNVSFINCVEDEQLWGKGHHELYIIHLLINSSIQGCATQMIQVPVLKNTYAFVSC